MSERLMRPTFEGEVSSLKARVDALERKLRKGGVALLPELTFVFPGALITTTSPKKRAPEERRYRAVTIDLVTAGTTATTLRLLKNGVAAGADIVLAAGVTYTELSLVVLVAPRTDTLQVQVVTPGTGAQSLTFDLWR